MIEITDLNLTSDDDINQVLNIIEKYLGKTRVEQAKELLKTNSAHFVLAKINEKIVGCGAYGFSGFHYNTWWIGLASVKSEYRKMGISNKLVEYRLKKIKSLGGKWVLVASMEPIERFLNKGFFNLLDMDTHMLLISNLEEK